MRVEILNRSGMRIPQKFLLSWCNRAEYYFIKNLRAKKAQNKVQDKFKLLLKKDLIIVFLDSASAKKINYEFRKKNYPTDVLSFSPIEENSLGELALCPQKIKIQAKEHQLTFKHELGYVVLHGILHLLGFDHEDSEFKAKRMYAIQDQIFDDLMSKH